MNFSQSNANKQLTTYIHQSIIKLLKVLYQSLEKIAQLETKK